MLFYLMDDLPLGSKKIGICKKGRAILFPIKMEHGSKVAEEAKNIGYYYKFPNRSIPNSR